LIFRKRSEYTIPLLFFILIAVLFPLSTTVNPNLLKIIGTGVIWVAVLLSTLLSLDHLFRDDFIDGTLEQWVLSPYPLSLLILIKIIAQWLLTSFPIIIIAPIVALMFHLPEHAAFVLMITLLLGTPTLNLIGASVAALTVGLRNSGVLSGLILLPFYIPTLIFATHAIGQAINGGLMAASLALLGALFIFSLILMPFISAASLRIGISYDY